MDSITTCKICGQVQDGAKFRLHDDPKKEWLEWNPEIPLPPEK